MHDRRMTPALPGALKIGIVAACLAGLATPARAQPFAEVGDSESGDFVGPQNLPGRVKRTPPASGGAASGEQPAPEPVAPEAPADPASWWERERATGDWGGLRSHLESRGLTCEASFVGEWFGVVGGGIDRRWTTRTLLDINATLDLDTVFGWDGGSVFADFYWIDGDSLSADAGDFQGASNIETDNRAQLAELWFEQTVLDGSLRFKLGKIEANAEFGFVDAAGEFVNSSAAFSPTLLPLPSYPDPSTGVIVSWSASEWLSFTGGFMDGAATVDGITTGDLGPSTFFSDDRSDDYVWLGEANVSWDGGRAGLGVWHHTGDFARFSGGTADGSTGFYAMGEHRVWSPGECRGVDLFAQFGWADEQISDATMHFGAGLAWWGPCETRADDAAGLYISHAVLSDPAGYDRDETALEVFYRFQATPFFAIKPDLQLILNPNGDPAADDALVAGVRVELFF